MGRSLDDGALVWRRFSDTHEIRLADCEAFVNQGVKTARAAALAASFTMRGWTGPSYMPLGIPISMPMSIITSSADM
jgi:hypothetical protein